MDAIWTPAQISIFGEWSLENGTEVMYTELYSDMRRADAATWIPDSEMIVETLNQTGFGCLELSANGLYGVKLQEGCEEQLRPSCEYTGKLLIGISLILWNRTILLQNPTYHSECVLYLHKICMCNNQFSHLSNKRGAHAYRF